MWGYQQTSRVNEPKDIRMWGCKDTSKHTEYINLRIRGCDDTRLQASTYELEDMKREGYKQAHERKDIKI